jgi:hypothetical protein
VNQDPPLYGFIRAEFAHLRRHQPGQPHTQEAPMHLIDTIEADLHAIGIRVDQATHDVLTKHLTTVNMLNHVARVAAGAEASPVLQALEAAALGPAAEAMVAGWVTGVAKVISDVDVAAQAAAGAVA